MSTTVDLGKITASVTVGTTTTGAAGTNASVSNSGTTQDAVLNFTIPRGEQGVQGQRGSTGPAGPAGPTGPQGPMGDVAVITPEQQAAFTMYSTTGQNTDGPMTQKAVTDNYPLISNTNNGDLELSDENSNVLARFKDGQIKVKFFDSATDAPLSSDSANDGDLEFSDSDNNVLVRFKNGHIITKNFNSEGIGSSMLEKFKNKKIAILGDSISTYNGWLPSNITGYNGATYATYYPSGNVNNPSKTWWYQMMQLLGLPVGGDTINVCAWSGSYVSGDSTSTTSAAAGCSTRRITDLAIRGWNPDIVIIFISCNDFAYDRPLGTWDVNSAIVAEGNITEMRAAYALMINKIHIAYPNARVFCCTNLDDYKRDKTAGYPSNNNNGVTTYTWNQSIKQIADAMACDVIDMHACGLNYANFQQFAVDTGTHPNAAGMSMMAQKAASELIAKY